MSESGRNTCFRSYAVLRLDVGQYKVYNVHQNFKLPNRKTLKILSIAII